MNRESFHQLEIAKKAIETTRITLASEVQEEAKNMNTAINMRARTVASLIQSSETIIVAGVHMEAKDFGAPTSEEIEKLGLVELKDGDKANSRVPQYGFHTISDYQEFLRAFPYYAILTEIEVRNKGVFPYTYCGYNELAHNKILKNCNKREPTSEEWRKIMEFAKVSGTNTLMQIMNTGFIGFRNANFQEFLYIGEGVTFCTSNPNGESESQGITFYRYDYMEDCDSTGLGHLFPIRAVAKKD